MFNQTNQGFSAANNQGFNIAKGDYILLMNPDAKLIDNHLTNALDFLNKNPLTLLGPKILNPDQSLQNSVIKIPGFSDILSETFFLTYFFRQNTDSILRSNNYALSGACLLMNRAVYENLNGLDENLFWMDDVDFCFRAGQQNMKVAYFPEWSVVHTIGVSSSKNYKTVVSNQLISKLKFFKKNNKRTDFYLSGFFIQIHILLRIIIFFFLSPFKKEFRQKLAAYLYTQKALLSYIFMKQNKLF